MTKLRCQEKNYGMCRYERERKGSEGRSVDEGRVQKAGNEGM